MPVTTNYLITGNSIAGSSANEVQDLLSSVWAQYSSQAKTDADALTSVLYTRTFQPGELIAGDALIVEGLITVPNSAATKTCKLQIGGIDYMSISLGTGNSTFHWRCKMRMRTLTSQIGWAVGSSNGAYGFTAAAANVTSNIDFSAPVVVQFTAQWPVAGAGANSIVLEAIDLQRMRA